MNKFTLVNYSVSVNICSFSRVPLSPPGLVPSVRIWTLDIRDSSTSKWLSPSRNRYLSSEQYPVVIMCSSITFSSQNVTSENSNLWLLERRHVMVSVFSDVPRVTAKVLPGKATKTHKKNMLKSILILFNNKNKLSQLLLILLIIILILLTAWSSHLPAGLWAACRRTPSLSEKWGCTQHTDAQGQQNTCGAAPPSYCSIYHRSSGHSADSDAAGGGKSECHFYCNVVKS